MSEKIVLVETGRSNVSDETIETICSEFLINEAWLRNGEGKMTDNAPVDVKNIGIRLKQFRKDMKLTQEQFAAATGYTNTQMVAGVRFLGTGIDAYSINHTIPTELSALLI